jgi:hypothetical protein
LSSPSSSPPVWIASIGADRDTSRREPGSLPVGALPSMDHA